MQIIIIPKSSGRVCRSCLSSRSTWMLGILLFLVIPSVVGGTTWYLTDRLNSGQHLSEVEQIAEQKIRLAELQQQISDIKRQSEADLDALSMQLGRMQAASMRTDALGQRLAEMAGLDKGEFDFTIAPGLGGTESEPVGKHLDMSGLRAAIDQATEKLSQEKMELTGITAMMETTATVGMTETGVTVT